MRKRTRKVLSIVLASAMVLSMHSMAFAADSAKKNEVTYDNGKVVIKNAEDPLSWNTTSGWDEAFNALTGHVEDDHLINGKKKTVSKNGYSASKNVIQLEGAEGSYLLFGYGADDMLPVEGEGEIPVTTYDGRKKAFKGESAGKDDAFDGVLALVKYDASKKEITKVDGVELTDFKMDKNNLHATISGSAIYSEKDHRDIYKKIEGKTTPTFTLKAKVKGKDIDKTVKKAINTTLKKTTFSYEILPLVVTLNGYKIKGTDGKLSENTVEYDSNVTTNITASKLNTKNAKANLTNIIWVSSKKGSSKKVEKKINPKDYTLKSETVGDQTILILDEFKTTDIEYSSDGLAGEGYKLCFREHGEKKNKTVKYGAYKSATDVFVTSVE